MLSTPDIIRHLEDLLAIAIMHYEGPEAAKLEIDREYWHGIANGFKASLRIMKEGKY